MWGCSGKFMDLESSHCQGEKALVVDVSRLSALSFCFDLSRGVGLSFFFFSSRRRHTRCSRDWSSDVCSSDLTCARIVPTAKQMLKRTPAKACVDNFLFENILHPPRWLEFLGRIILPAALPTG